MSWLALHAEPVRPEWIDYNGHMSEAYYVLAFSNATDVFLEWLGLDAAYRSSARRSIYTVESHVRYLREVGVGVRLEITTAVVGVDAKRLHFCHRMTADGVLLATFEVMTVCVDTAAGRATAFDPALRERLAGLVIDWRPDWCGRAIGLPAR